MGSPSLFDLCVCSFIVILPMCHVPGIQDALIRGVFFVFGTVVLMCVGMVTVQQRRYRNWPLALLVLWSVRSAFNFSFMPDMKTVGKLPIPELTLAMGKLASGFVNWAMMNEGLMYIVFGAFLICTIVRYAKSHRWYYVALFPVLIGWVLLDVFALRGHFEGHARSGYFDWSMTPILATALATVIVLLLLRKWKIAIPAVLGGIGVVLFKWSYIWKVKWISRPDIWRAVISRIKWFGRGFYHLLNTKDGFVAPEHAEFGDVLTRWGRGWRQNDLLEFGEYQGLLAMGIVVWLFLALLLKKQRIGVAYFLVLTSVLMCLFQRTMFFIEKGGTIAIMVSLLILSQKKEEEDEQESDRAWSTYTEEY